MALYKNLKKALANPLEVSVLKIKINTEKLELDISSFKNLKGLYIQSSKLNNIESLELSNSSTLETLQIQSDKLEFIPATIFNSSLTNLNLNTCNIKKIDLNVPVQSQIKTLNLSANKLEKIPAQIYHLETLENLYLNNNLLTKIDKEICFLQNLKRLNLDRNKLTSFNTKDILKLNQLISISLDYNPFPESEKTKIERDLNYWFGEL